MRTKAARTAETVARTPRRVRNDPPSAGPIEDFRFRQLLDASAWNSLPPAVRARFSKRVGDGVSIVYKGRVCAIRFSRLGFALAQFLRLAGAPLPVSRATGLESAVAVTEDRTSGGQFWTRIYLRERGFPQVIHSVKRFGGPTGIEECVGAGIVMALKLSVEEGALVFRSCGFGIALGRWRLPLPALFEVTVTHTQIHVASFRFTLSLTSSMTGELLYQEAEYTEERRT